MIHIYYSRHFEDGTVISGTTHDPYDPDDSKILTPGALTQIFQKIKEIVDSIRDIVDGAKDLTESIENITNNITDITEKINDIMKKLSENDINNKEQDNIIQDNEDMNIEQVERLDIVDASPPFTIDAATFYEFEEYVLNPLKQLTSKMKTLTIVVDNSNNYTGYSILSGKSEAVESGYGFMRILGL
jgi:vacuolar-type H+-ATPase subunit I/STV1